MIQEKKISLVRNILTFVMWVFIFSAPLLFSSEVTRSWTMVYKLWVEMAIVLSAFLVNHYILSPLLFFRRKYVKYFIYTALFLFLIQAFVVYCDGLGWLVRYLSGDYSYGYIPKTGGVMNEIGEMVKSKPVVQTPLPLITPRVVVVLFSTLIILLDMGFTIAIKWMTAEHRQSELERKSMSVKLANLQSQVSPHFLMNTLNNIHALVGIDPKKAQETIIELSGLMDYLLYDCSGSESVAASREIDFTRSYVALMKLRYPERVNIEFVCPREVPTVMLPPLLFLNFVENAFKYGVDYGSESSIRIEMRVSEDSAEITVENTNHSDLVKRPRKGLGIKNAKDRLNLIYGNRYSLEIEHSAEKYSVNLKVPVL